MTASAFSTVGAPGPQAAAVMAAVARPASVPATFDPLSVTFTSLSTGWALGMAPCPSTGTCLALRSTTDSGRTWSAEPLPAALVSAADRKVNGAPAVLTQCCFANLDVRFANAEDGWIYGGLEVSSPTAGTVDTTLWSTHDGGAVWRQQHLPSPLATQGSVFDLEAIGGQAYLMAPNKNFSVSVESTPVSQDNWRPATSVPLRFAAGGGQQSGAFVFQGGKGWLVEGNDRGTTGSAQLASDGDWVSWVPPCASVGGTFAVPAASTADDLVAICVMGGFASPLTKSAPPGATVGSSWLYFSDNSGRSWYAGPELGPIGQFFGGVLASPAPGTILLSRGNQSQALALSSDGGHHWASIYKGNFFYLGFTSPAQGVALVRSTATSTKMIMTFDGGHRWAKVSF